MRWLMLFALAAAMALGAAKVAAQEAEPIVASSPETGRGAIENFERAAADGNLQALVRLGEIYQEGRVVTADPVRALTYFETAAIQGSAAGKLRLGEAYITGTGVVADVGSGLALLEEAAAAGDIRARMRLADEYAVGEHVDANPAKAIAYYEQAAALGSTRALLRLASAYRDGTFGEPDLEKANSYFRRAAEEGSLIGRARLGEALLRGRGVGRDIAGALDLLDSAAGEGDPTALYLMGELLSRGEFVEPEPSRALRFYEQAGEAGYLLAYNRLGELYRDGILVPRSPRRSISYYERAADLGLLRAKVELGKNHANGLYGSASRVSYGVALIREALRGGEELAVPALANLHLWGIGVNRSVRRAVSVLTEAASDGNVVATKLLISYYRDGRRSLIGQNVGRARRILARYEDNLTPEEREAETILIAATGAYSRAEFRRLSDRIEALAPMGRTAVVSSLRTANPNLFVYVVQTRLTEQGRYSGPLNGRLTARTIEAVNRLCRQAFADRVCEKGPLDPETAAFVAQLIG